MAATRFPQNDVRRSAGSPRPKTRDSKDTLCRNVLIYGFCRYEESGCAFNHEQHKNSPGKMEFSSKKTFSAESPSFTPSSILQPNATKTSTLPSQAANAAPFMPRQSNGTASSSGTSDTAPLAFNPATIKEFTPQQNHDFPSSAAVASQGPATPYSDPFATVNTLGHALSTAATPFNPYAANEHDVVGNSGSAFFQQPAGYSSSLQPLNYHLYAPMGSQRADLQPWERSTYDWFLPEKLREEIQKKTHAALQVLPNSTLPQVERWHSLVPIDTTNNRNATTFGYTNWIYKTQDSRNGTFYAMRRLGGFTLTNPDAISETLKRWRKIHNAGVVRLHETFTTQAFGDKSLVFIYDYHPMSKTLAEHHFPATLSKHERKPHAIPENVLWSYIAQISNAMAAIHGGMLAARCIDLGKIILTGKNRIRLAACGTMDVLNYGNGACHLPAAIQQGQRDDFVKFGLVMLSLATSTFPTHLGNHAAALNSLNGRCTRELRDLIEWLITSAAPGQTRSVDELLARTARPMAASLDLSLHMDDNLNTHLSREVENGRVARLMFKMMTLMTESDQNPTPKWSQFGGELYPLKLFRLYVFNPTEGTNGNSADGTTAATRGGPRSMGHVLTCLNKLDVGTDEQIQLNGDEGDVFVLSYRELKQLFDRAFNDIEMRGKEGNVYNNRRQNASY